MIEFTISIPYPPEWFAGFVLIWLIFGLIVTLIHSARREAENGGMFIRGYSNLDLLWLIPFSALIFPYTIWKWRKT